jgi:hypothetical protein
MARNQIQWEYTTMTSEFFTVVNATNGVFGLTIKSEWKISPKLTLSQKLGPLLTPWKFLLGTADTKMAIDASMHLYDYEIRSTGTSSCHVAIKRHGSKSSDFEFDLPTTSEDEFVQALEKIGDAKVEHPWFLNDLNSYGEGVSLDGVTTKVTFERKSQ